jgi:hypothetical protein
MVMVTCEQCGYGESFSPGIGFMYDPVSVFYGDRKPLLVSLVKNSGITQKALNLLRNGGVPDSYGHEIYGCPHCKSLHERFYFRIVADGDPQKTLFEPEYECLKCGRVLVCLRVETNTKNFPWGEKASLQWNCPACGYESLAVNSVGNWD